MIKELFRAIIIIVIIVHEKMVFGLAKTVLRYH